MRCARQHNFDIAKQGYVNLLAGRRAPSADTLDMVAARVNFLDADHFASLAKRIAQRVIELAPAAELVVDAGSGTGYYLNVVLSQLPSATGIALDSSALALRQAARVNPRVGAVVWDIWRPWPIKTVVADVVINIFAPRNPAEFHRVMSPNGLLVIVTPLAKHLAELRELAGILSVGDDKQHRVDRSLDGRFHLIKRETYTAALTLSADDVRNVVMMGPTAHHVQKAGRSAKLAAITGHVTVTAACELSFYRPS